MNKLTLAVSLLVTVLLSHNAAADSRHDRQGLNNSRADGNHFRSYNRDYNRDYNRSYNRSHNRGFERRGNRNYARAAANPYHYGQAGNRRGNDFASISYGNSFYNSGFNNRYESRFGNRYNNRFNRRSNRRSNNNFYNNGYRNRWDRNRSGSNFVGGLVLGSLLSQQNYPSRSHENISYRSAPVIVKRNIVYVNSTSRATVSATPKRRLLRDLRGNCYDIEISPNGDELRSQIDSASCDF